MADVNDGKGADIDIQVVPLVGFVNRFGLHTVSSCQGAPGVIGEGGRYGHVSYMDSNDPDDYSYITRITFKLFRELFESLYDDVRLEVYITEGPHPVAGFIGAIRFRNEALTEVTKRLGNYCEMERVGND